LFCALDKGLEQEYGQRRTRSNLTDGRYRIGLRGPQCNSGEKLPGFIGSVYAALSKASIQGVESQKAELKPAIAVGVHHLPRRWQKVQIPQAALGRRSGTETAAEPALAGPF